MELVFRKIFILLHITIFIMIFITSGRVMREGARLLNDLKVMFARGVNIRQALISNPELKKRVDSFLKDLRKAIDKVQEEIRYIVDSPVYNRENKKRLIGLRYQLRALSSQQDNILNYIGK